jgi:hypothetical protein
LVDEDSPPKRKWKESYDLHDHTCLLGNLEGAYCKSFSAPFFSRGHCIQENQGWGESLKFMQCAFFWICNLEQASPPGSSKETGWSLSKRPLL